ncbi:MAG: hypothetical protein R3C52_00130 [Hyphomonadaceae bacterium]
MTSAVDHTAGPTQSAPASLTAAEIARVRESGALGNGGRLLELFDYLAERSGNDSPPKEAEIAIEVFGKSGADATRDDPVARVYVHRLRKRLDDFYLRDSSPSGVRLTIPKGEYRLVGLEAVANSDANPENVPEQPGRTPWLPAWLDPRQMGLDWRSMAAGGLAVGILALLANFALWAATPAAHNPAEKALMANAPVSSLMASERPLLVVVGDYYIFGEYEDRLFLKRLVRDFSVNSKADLMEKYLVSPKEYDRYADVSLQYLPTSSAYALADLAPVLEHRNVRVVLASELSPEQIKSNDILYLGLISGLGALKGPVFEHSRFGIGESYDEIVDRKAGRRYLSEAFLAAPGDNMYRDYGLLSSFSGPSGNRFLILAGARDTGLMGLTDSLVNGAANARMASLIDKQTDVEALFEVKGQKHVNLETKVVVADNLDSAAIWSASPTHRLEFPKE